MVAQRNLSSLSHIEVRLVKENIFYFGKQKGMFDSVREREKIQDSTAIFVELCG